MNRIAFRRAVAALACLPLLALGACTANGPAPEPVINADVTNNTDVTVRVSLHAGERVRLREDPILPTKDGRAVEIVRGTTETVSISRPREWGIGPLERNEELVFWLRTEVITPTWGEDNIRWFELLGPPSSRFTLRRLKAEVSRGSDLVVQASTVPAEPVDPGMYPFRDRNRAFRVDAGLAGAGASTD
ncbi:MAG: hypothetical protein AAF995_10780 [Planctomycetota bacterium]